LHAALELLRADELAYVAGRLRADVVPLAAELAKESSRSELSEAAGLLTDAPDELDQAAALYRQAIALTETYLARQGMSGAEPMTGYGQAGDPGVGSPRPPVARKITRDDLTPVQLANLVRYVKKLPAAADGTTITTSTDGSIRFETRVPGRVPGSCAVYTKIIDPAGRTIAYTKKTVLPNGSVAHIKDKMSP
jgi:hypothetical protein